MGKVTRRVTGKRSMAMMADVPEEGRADDEFLDADGAVSVLPISAEVPGECDELPDDGGQADESHVQVGEHVLSALASEVALATAFAAAGCSLSASGQRGKQRCLLCPFRSFPNQAALQKHLVN